MHVLKHVTRLAVIPHAELQMKWENGADLAVITPVNEIWFQLASLALLLLVSCYLYVSVICGRHEQRALWELACLRLCLCLLDFQCFLDSIRVCVCVFQSCSDGGGDARFITVRDTHYCWLQMHFCILHTLRIPQCTALNMLRPFPVWRTNHLWSLYLNTLTEFL